MPTARKNSKTPRRNKNESSQPEPEVPVQVPASSSRKGKRQSDSSTDLQPSSKKSYNLRKRTPLSEEEISQPVEGGMEAVENVKETAEDIKLFSEGTKEGCQEEKDNDEEIQDVNATTQDSNTLSQDHKEAQGCEIENVIEIAQDSNVLSQDDKVAQGCQEEKNNDEEIQDVNATTQDRNMLSQDHKEAQGCQEEKDNDQEIQDVNATTQDSNTLSQDYKEAQGCQEEKDNDKEIQDVNATTQDSNTVSKDHKEAQVYIEKTTAEELVNVEVDTPKVSNQLSTKRKRKRKSSSSTKPEIPEAAGSKILFVGNLPFSVDHDNMLKFFEDVGGVVDIRMAKRIDGSMKGFCHVTFETEEAAKKAVDKNGEVLGGRNVKLDFAKELRKKHAQNSGAIKMKKDAQNGGAIKMKKDAQNGGAIKKKKDVQKCTVFVKGFEKSQKEEDVQKGLMKHFGNCGGIKTVRIRKDISLGCLKGDACIEFEDNGALSKALKLSGSDLGNCKLFVKKVAARNKVRRNAGKGHRKKHSKKEAAVKDTKEVCQ